MELTGCFGREHETEQKPPGAFRLKFRRGTVLLEKATKPW